MGQLTPPKTGKLEAETEYDEWPSPKLKSHLSDPSTVDSSPLRLSVSEAELEEEAGCMNFHEDGFCLWGEHCNEAHMEMEKKNNRRTILS